jgi:hypothetical protein
MMCNSCLETSNVFSLKSSKEVAVAAFTGLSNDDAKERGMGDVKVAFRKDFFEHSLSSN